MCHCSLPHLIIPCNRDITSLIVNHAIFGGDSAYVICQNQYSTSPPDAKTKYDAACYHHVLFIFRWRFSQCFNNPSCTNVTVLTLSQIRLVPAPPSVKPVPCPFSHSPISTWYAFRFRSSWFQLCTRFIFGLQLSVGLARISPWLFLLSSGMRIGSAALACAWASA